MIGSPSFSGTDQLTMTEVSDSLDTDGGDGGTKITGGKKKTFSTFKLVLTHVINNTTTMKLPEN